MTDIDIRKIRESRGWSQEELASMLGVHPRTIQNWEAGSTIPKSKHAILRQIISGNIAARKVYGGQHVLGGDAVNGDKIVEKFTEREIEIDKAEIECDPLIAALQSTIADQKDQISFLQNQLADANTRLTDTQSQLADANKRIQTLTDKLLNI